MSDKQKLIPAFVMLLAGAIAILEMSILHYEMKLMLVVLLGVLILFFILGKVMQKCIVSFEKALEEKAKEEEEAEGKVVEKDEKEIQKNNSLKGNEERVGGRRPSLDGNEREPQREEEPSVESEDE